MTLEIAWTDANCSVGIMRLDEEHRYLLDLINQVANSVEGKEDIGDTIPLWHTQFKQYAAIHFTHEENIMARHLADWPLRESHLKAHLNYWDLVAEMSKESTAADLLAFLKNWWLSHIQGIDRKMGQELTDRGISEFDLEMLF